MPPHLLSTTPWTPWTPPALTHDFMRHYSDPNSLQACFLRTGSIEPVRLEAACPTSGIAKPRAQPGPANALPISGPRASRLARARRRVTGAQRGQLAFLPGRPARGEVPAPPSLLPRGQAVAPRARRARDRRDRRVARRAQAARAWAGVIAVVALMADAVHGGHVARAVVLRAGSHCLQQRSAASNQVQGAALASHAGSALSAEGWRTECRLWLHSRRSRSARPPNE